MKMFEHKYYYEKVRRTYKFIVPEGKTILFLGVFDTSIIASLPAKKAVIVEPEKEVYLKAKKKLPKTIIFNTPFEKFIPKENFDFILINGALGKTNNLMSLLKNLQKGCKPTTRIIVYQHNHLWQWFLSLAEKFSWKKKEGIQNWLSINDTKVYLNAAGYEATRIFKSNLFPLGLLGFGELINWVSNLIPFFDFLKLDQYIVARPLVENLLSKNTPESLTICITVRNEKQNIEGIVKKLPILTKNQEILFVEGHSTDGTKEEIERVSKLNRSKNIRVIGQPGKGQGDAIRVGFKQAKGDIIILYEGDGTSDAGDLIYFYEAMKSGRFEFIEGSRFVYPLDKAAMPFFNRIGNIFFAKWFSFFLGQRTTDVLSGIKSILKRDYLTVYERWGFLGLQDPFGDFELLYGAARMGLRIGEIPMRYYPRVYGASKTNVFTHGPYLFRMALKGYWIFRNHKL